MQVNSKSYNPLQYSINQAHTQLAPVSVVHEKKVLHAITDFPLCQLLWRSHDDGLCNLLTLRETHWKRGREK